MFPLRPLALAIGATMLAAAVSACGGSGGTVDLVTKPGDPGSGSNILVTGGTTGTVIDACSLLTAEEASDLAGESLREPSLDNYANGQSVCTFGATRFMSYTFVQVSLFVESPQMNSDGYTARQMFEEQRKANQPTEEIDNIGEDAFRHANSLEVLAGTTTFGVRIAMADPGGMVSVPQEDLETMARIVLARLSNQQG